MTTLHEVNLFNGITPGECTSVIHTSDDVRNAPLKAHLRSCWDEWMNTGLKTYTKGGNMRIMMKTQWADHIVKAWDMITPGTIIKSFKICGQVLDLNHDKLLCMQE